MLSVGFHLRARHASPRLLAVYSSASGRPTCVICSRCDSTIATAVLFSSRTAQDLQHVHGSQQYPQARPHSEHTTAIRYELLRSYVRLLFVLLSGSRILLPCAPASLNFRTFHLFCLKLKSARPRSVAELGRYRVSLSPITCQNMLSRKS